MSELSSSQLAQYVQSLGASNDTDLIDRVFEELEDGDALQNVDEFLTQLTANGKVGWGRGRLLDLKPSIVSTLICI